MKTVAIALSALVLSSAAFAQGVQPSTPAPAAVAAWNADQAAIRDSYAKLPAAEQQALQATNAYWAEKSFKENLSRH